jgi:hypothetical protein
MNKIKLSKKQKEVVKLMQDGWILLVGQSETNGSVYQYVSKGYDRVDFNATVFYNLVGKGIVFQQQHHPFNYVLTSLGESIDIS